MRELLALIRPIYQAECRHDRACWTAEVRHHGRRGASQQAEGHYAESRRLLASAAVRDAAEKLVSSESLDERVTAEILLRKAEEQRVSPDSRLANLQAKSARAWPTIRTAAAYRDHVQRVLTPLLRAMQEWHAQTRPDVEPYTACMQYYAPWASFDDAHAQASRVWERIGCRVRSFAHAAKPETSYLRTTVPLKEQQKLHSAVARQLGFDLRRGSIDYGRSDVTYSFEEVHPVIAKSGGWHRQWQTFIHELFHGLRDQRNRRNWLYTPLGHEDQLDVHETEAVFGEDLLSVSPVFTRTYFSQLRGTVPVPDSFDTFYRDILWPRFVDVRDAADSLTYTGHVLVELTLQRAVMQNELRLLDLPGARQEMLERVLGLRIADPVQSLTTDPFWGELDLGRIVCYQFAQYAAAQLMESMANDGIKLGFNEPTAALRAINPWLDSHFRFGARHSLGTAVQIATGKPLTTDSFVAYAHARMDCLSNL